MLVVSALLDYIAQGEAVWPSVILRLSVICMSAGEMNYTSTVKINTSKADILADPIINFNTA